MVDVRFQFMASIAELEKRIGKIEERNKRVELDKKWETSYVRRGLLVLFTYLSVGIYFQFIGIKDAWLNAIVPAVAFLLSTLTLPFFKGVWAKHIKE
ncbi:MAG: hypothetical protein ABII22_01155 [Candidatus Micrarchaeota archaeon]